MRQRASGAQARSDGVIIQIHQTHKARDETVVQKNRMTRHWSRRENRGENKTLGRTLAADLIGIS